MNAAEGVISQDASASPLRRPLKLKTDERTLKTGFISRGPRAQFFEPQPALNAGTSSPGLNTGCGGLPEACAIFVLSSSTSCFAQPTLEVSIVPSGAMKKMVGTLVNPYAFETA